MYVPRQLGHAEISTTERYYGHLERHVLAAGAVATEEAIARGPRSLDQRLLLSRNSEPSRDGDPNWTPAFAEGEVLGRTLQSAT